MTQYQWKATSGFSLTVWAIKKVERKDIFYVEEAKSITTHETGKPAV